MSEHTPGPWTPYGLDWRMVVDKDSEVIADVRTHDADARLIAAAPDLLAALEALMTEACDDIAHQDEHTEAAEAAIAKAKGES